MNRKEFTNLLLEWRKNFIHERGKYSSSFNQPDDAYLSTLRDTKGEVIEDLKEHICNINNIPFKRNKVGALIIEKNQANISMISEFIKKRGFEKEANNIDRETNNYSPLFITFETGDFSFDSSDYSFDENRLTSGDPDITWMLHDIVHVFIDGRIDRESQFESNALKNKVLSHFSKEYLDLQKKLKFGGLSDMIREVPTGEEYEGLPIYGTHPDDAYMLAALQKFFNEIDFTAGVGPLDSGPSLVAYCWMKLSHSEDFAQVESCKSLNSKEKDIVKSHIRRIFPLIKRQKQIILNGFKGTILIFSNEP